MRDLGDVRIADYVLAVEGLAMIRDVLTKPSSIPARVAEVEMVLAGSGEGLLAQRMKILEYDVEDGYTHWAPSYDGPNPAIELETPIVESIVRDLSPGTALDAACGTARHAALLDSLGWKVIGVDGTDAMLDVARSKVPGADFRVGRLEALPVDDGSVDLVVCALALTHVEDLRPVYADFARVLRPGGRVVTTDIHPIFTITGLMAGFPKDGLRRAPGAVPSELHFVPNLTHHTSEYVDAILGAGLRLSGCREPLIDEDGLALFPTFATLPDATRQAYLGLPFILVWEAVKPG